MKKILLNIYLWPAFAVTTLLGLLLLPGILFVDLIFRGRTLRSSIRCAIRFYGWLLVTVVPFFGPVRVVYKNPQLPLPAIFVANHNSAVDPYLFGAIPVENGFLTSWPFNIPLYNIFMHLAGYVNADKGWEELLVKGEALLKQGSSLTIWPEGHRSRDGQLGRFRRGAFRLAVETGRPVVPVCIIGSGKILPPGSRLLNPGRITLLVLDPVYPERGDDTQELAIAMKNRVRDIIEDGLREYDHFSSMTMPVSN